MNHPYRLSKSAIADLKNIINYTRQSFGEAQLKRYISTLARIMYELDINKRIILSIDHTSKISSYHPPFEPTIFKMYFLFYLKRIIEFNITDTQN